MKVPALLLALVICLGILNAVNLTPLLGPLLYTMTPLQRYYATDYLASTWHRDDPTATTETRLLWKTRKGKSELATEQDLVQLPLGQRLGTYSPEPFRLSDQALAEGWTALHRENPHEVKSALLENVLEQQVYDGYPFWRFFAQPALGLAVLFVVWLVMGAWRRERWKRNMWNTRGKANLSFWAWSVEVSDRITQHLLPRPKDPEIVSTTSPGQLELQASVPQLILTASAAPSEPKSTSKSVAAQPPAATPPTMKPTVVQAVPVAAVPKAKPKPAFVWDESQGID